MTGDLRKEGHALVLTPITTPFVSGNKQWPDTHTVGVKNPGLEPQFTTNYFWAKNASPKLAKPVNSKGLKKSMSNVWKIPTELQLWQRRDLSVTKMVIICVTRMVIISETVYSRVFLNRNVRHTVVNQSKMKLEKSTYRVYCYLNFDFMPWSIINKKHCFHVIYFKNKLLSHCTCILCKTPCIISFNNSENHWIIGLLLPNL